MLEFFFFLKSHCNQHVLNCKLFAGKSRALNGTTLLQLQEFTVGQRNSFDLKNLYSIPKIFVSF